MHLKTKNTTPPGGWRYRQPETGHVMTGTVFRELVAKVATHRNNMRIETTGILPDEVEAVICANLSPEDQHEYCADGMPEHKSVSWKLVLKFLETMVSWATSSRETVPQEEAERRAAICENCPLNIGMHGCGMCQSALKEFRERLLKRGTSHDSSLRACGVCGCDNKLQVHVPLEVLRKEDDKRGLVFPDFCWKSKKVS